MRSGPKAEVPPRFMNVLARNLSLLMCQQDITSQVLADELGISIHVVNRLRGNRTKLLNPEVLQGICQVLKCTPNDLLLPLQQVYYTSP